MSAFFESFSNAFRAGMISRPEGRLVVFALAFFLILFGIQMFFLPMPLILASAALFLVLGFVLFFLLGKLAGFKQDTQIERNELKGILVNLEDALMVYDKDFKIIFFNPAAEKLFRLSKEQVVGRTITPQEVGNEAMKLLVQVVFLRPEPIRKSPIFPGRIHF